MNMNQPTVTPSGGHWIAIAAPDSPEDGRKATLPVVGWERGIADGKPALWSWLMNGASFVRSDKLNGYHVEKYRDVTPQCGCQPAEPDEDE